MTPQVHILTTCRNEESLPGNMLIFRTLRVGFPTAEAHVYDNATEYSRDIAQLAVGVDALFVPLLERQTHWQWIRRVLRKAKGPTVILDPDIIFWEKVEDWNLDDGLLWGRLIPEYWDDLNHHLRSKPRLHSSFWWIPNARALEYAIRNIEIGTGHVSGGSLWHPFTPFAYPDRDGKWSFFDVGAGLYSALTDQMRPFGPEQLDAYDHLFAGTVPDVIRARCRGMELLEHKAAADGRLAVLRGLWRGQEVYFQRRACKTKQTVVQ